MTDEKNKEKKAILDPALKEWIHIVALSGALMVVSLTCDSKMARADTLDRSNTMQVEYSGHSKQMYDLMEGIYISKD